MDTFKSLDFIDDADSLAHYGRDETRFWPAAPAGIVFPESTEEVAEIVAIARREKIALVPSGGRTGLSGGAVASRGEVVVSMDRMRKLIELDAADPSLTAQAGMPVGELQNLAAEAGLFYPVDWAASGSSQLGGSIATNAGGIRVLRYGMTRNWVRGLTVVTGAGEILRLNHGLVKNNTGPDLCQLMIGSEGTLGFITEATMALTTPPPQQSVLMVSFADMESIMPVFSALRHGLRLSAFEFFDQASAGFVAAATGREFPLDQDAPCHAIVEFDDPEQGCQEQALALFEELMEAGHLVDGTLSQSVAQAQELWRWREGISEALSRHTPYKNDLSVRVSRLPAFLDELKALVAHNYPEFQVVWFGHLGDGNLHMNVLKPADWATDDFHTAGQKLSQHVFELVRRFDGSVSAEHGVGLLKRDDLHYSRSTAEIALLKQIKRAFDPDGILNPGKLLPA